MFMNDNESSVSTVKNQPEQICHIVGPANTQIKCLEDSTVKHQGRIKTMQTLQSVKRH